MNAIPSPISLTDETVTLSRADWEAYVAAQEDRIDLAAHDAAMSEYRRTGFAWTLEESLAMIEHDTHPIAVLRARNGMSRTALAAAAGVHGTYLASIEGRTKPGSVKAMAAIAKALGVPMEVVAG